MRMYLRLALACLTALCCTHTAWAQELNAKVTINHQKIANTRNELFEEAQQKMQSFLNEHQWTGMQFREQERIACNFMITVNEYDEGSNEWKCTLLMNSQRPVFNSTYNTTAYSINDKDFNFNFQSTDQLEFSGSNMISSNLVALLSYYAYMIIGIDLDTMSPKGGTEVFNIAEDIVTNAESLGYTGWKAFGDNDNRFALLNDYLDGSMESMRTLQYRYHREGLDHMADNASEARKVIGECLTTLLAEAHEAKTMSRVPQLFTEYKRDEMVNIFSGQGTSSEKQPMVDVLRRIDASQSNTWDKLLK